MVGRGLEEKFFFVPARDRSAEPTPAKLSQTDVAKISNRLRDKALATEKEKEGHCSGKGPHAPPKLGGQPRGPPTVLQNVKGSERNKTGDLAIFKAWENGERSFRKSDIIGCRFRRQVDKDDLLKKRWEQAADEEKFKEEWLSEQCKAQSRTHPGPFGTHTVFVVRSPFGADVATTPIDTHRHPSPPITTQVMAPTQNAVF
eukprot:9480414-Pyramimonas_sp.AAC.1